MTRLERGLSLPLFNLFKMMSLGSTDIPVFIYHSVLSSGGPGAINVEIFKRHLQFLRENDFQVVPLAALLEPAAKPKPARGNLRRVSLTFDDGYVDFFHNCWTLLKDYNFPATIFLVVDKIGREGYLSEGQIKEVSSGGLISLGSHGMAHKYLIGLSHADLRREVRDSKVALERRFSSPVDFFSYPWGGFSARTQDAVREAGYKAAFTTNQFLADRNGKDDYAFKRITISEKDGSIRFLAKVSGFAYLFARRMKREE
ncbi:MAG TPA: polysaccharide deacetylase family protein [Candidatus Margulisiibacteriota bacterium]|nr:polysaccharide deacetylase family protein [Candidatus Margulisiibacteriota bacterium]